jgi:hypothetical protein
LARQDRQESRGRRVWSASQVSRASQGCLEIQVRPAAREISAHLVEMVRMGWTESQVYLDQAETAASRDRTAYLVFRDWRDRPGLRATLGRQVCQDIKDRPVNKAIQVCQAQRGPEATVVLLALQGWKASRGQWDPRDRQG